MKCLPEICGRIHRHRVPQIQCEYKGAPAIKIYNTIVELLPARVVHTRPYPKSFLLVIFLAAYFAREFRFHVINHSVPVENGRIPECDPAYSAECVLLFGVWKMFHHMVLHQAFVFASVERDYGEWRQSNWKVSK